MANKVEEEVEEEKPPPPRQIDGHDDVIDD